MITKPKPNQPYNILGNPDLAANSQLNPALVHPTPPFKLSGSAAMSFSNLAADAASTQAVTVTGAKAGDKVQLAFSPPLPAGISAFGVVSADDTVTAKAVNETAAAATYSGTVSAEAWPVSAYAPGRDS